MAQTGPEAPAHSLQTDTLIIPVAGSTDIWPGADVCTDENGYAVPAADVDGYVYEGFALNACDVNGIPVRSESGKINNADGDDGDVYVRVQRRGYLRRNTVAPATQAHMSARAYVFDDNTVALEQADCVNLVEHGRVMRIISGSQVDVAIDCPCHCNPRVLSGATTTTTTTAGA